MDRHVSLTVKGCSYAIEFPNVGSFQNIETMKQVLSKGMYASLLSTGTSSAIQALDMIDVEAYFTVLCPKLIKDLKCKNFSELDLMDYMELNEIYRKEFIPWWNSILNMLKPEDEKIS